MTNRILLVDDELDMESLFRQGLRRELKAGKVEMIFATGVDAAMTMITDDRIEPFNMVISDLNMPGKSGFDLLASMDTSTFEIAVVSANADLDTRARVEAMGAAAFFAKPINFGDVRSFVTALQME